MELKAVKAIDQSSDRELLVRILDNQERIEAQLTELTAQHQTLRQFVFGNGTPGLAGQVRDLQGKIGAISKFGYALLVPVAVAALGLLWGMLSNRVDILVR